MSILTFGLGPSGVGGGGGATGIRFADMKTASVVNNVIDGSVILRKLNGNIVTQSKKASIQSKTLTASGKRPKLSAKLDEC